MIFPLAIRSDEHCASLKLNISMMDLKLQLNHQICTFFNIFILFIYLYWLIYLFICDFLRLTLPYSPAWIGKTNIGPSQLRRWALEFIALVITLIVFVVVIIIVFVVYGNWAKFLFQLNKTILWMSSNTFQYLINFVVIGIIVWLPLLQVKGVNARDTWFIRSHYISYSNWSFYCSKWGLQFVHLMLLYVPNTCINDVVLFSCINDVVLFFWIVITLLYFDL